MPIEILLSVVAPLGIASAVLAIALSWRRKRLLEWRKAAAECGLGDVVVGNSLFRPAVDGTSGALTVRIEHYHRGKSDTGTRVIVRGPAHPFGSLTIRGEGLASSLDKHLLGTRETEVGDAAFDRECFVLGRGALALATLTAAARQDVAALVQGSLRLESGQTARVRGSIKDGSVRIELRNSLFARPWGFSDVLRAALRIAHAIEPPADVAARLRQNLEGEPEPGVRVRLLQALVEVYPRHALTREALQAGLVDRAEEVRLRAAVELGAEGLDTLHALATAGPTSDSVRARAVTALGPHAGRELLVVQLRASLAVGRWQTARACLHALQPLHRSEDEPLLLQALGVPDPDVALAAARVLGVCGSIAAVAPLLELARTAARDDVRQAARQGVGEIQARVPGAGPGQLTLADAAAGALSLADTTASGQLSLADESHAGTAGHSIADASAAGGSPLPDELAGENAGAAGEGTAVSSLRDDDPETRAASPEDARRKARPSTGE